ncbi:MAG: deoxyribose-phosphate aldolase [Spirochaetaceae bacterium]|jgi:deoxyribose-phosphate aldolase|nr:deoxyribose-phosphate aldolase [Spirochaetaceae bacterium]
MDNAAIFSHVDHTLLAAAASWKEMEGLCREAVQYKTASVCVPPSYIKRIAESFAGLNVCAVIGFPLGYSVLNAKRAEAKAAIADGAREVDMVVNIGDVKNGAFDRVTAEIRVLKKTVGNNILKVIIETCYLTMAEKVALCRCVTDGGADYIKTSTGFGPAGATLEDVLLFKEHIGPMVKIKAAGGIRSREDMVAYLEAGCDRLGTSSAVKLLAGGATGGYEGRSLTCGQQTIP